MTISVMAASTPGVDRSIRSVRGAGRKEWGVKSQTKTNLMEGAILTAFGGAAIVGVLILAAILSLLLAVPFWFAWNLVVPPVFNGPALNFWQAWGVAFLIRVILGGLARSRP